MVRSIFTNKWIIGGILLLIIIAGGCYFWYQHSLAADRKAAADAQQLLRQSEIERQAKQKAAKQTKTESTQAPAENNTAEKSVNKVTAEVENNTEAKTGQQSAPPAETEAATDVPVSPFGFGPYPKVPDGMVLSNGKPYKPEWEDPDYPNHEGSRDFELIDRVWIKKWEEGDRSIVGAGFYPEYNRVFLNYPNVVYVTWDETEDDDGNTVRYITRMSGNPSAAERIRNNSITRLGRPGPKIEADIPAGIEVILHSDGGIDPYEYLNLSSK